MSPTRTRRLRALRSIDRWLYTSRNSPFGQTVRTLARDQSPGEVSCATWAGSDRSRQYEPRGLKLRHRYLSSQKQSRTWSITLLNVFSKWLAN